MKLKNPLVVLCQILKRSLVIEVVTIGRPRKLGKQHEYDVWGKVIQKTESVPNPFRYTGEIQDEESGLIYLRSRYYDPSIGRFISQDTYEGELNNPLTLNLYTYVENNPVLCFLLSKLKSVGISNKSA